MLTRFISHIYYIVSPLLTAELFLKTWLLVCTQPSSLPCLDRQPVLPGLSPESWPPVLLGPPWPLLVQPPIGESSRAPSFQSLKGPELGAATELRLERASEAKSLAELLSIWINSAFREHWWGSGKSTPAFSLLAEPGLAAGTTMGADTDRAGAQQAGEDKEVL